MTSEWRRVRELHALAMDLPRDERRAFVELECAGDLELKDELLSLLEASTEDDGFLETPALPGLQGTLLPGALEPGTRVGPYTVLRVLGTGGMGVVYEVQQDEPRRRVALKMMRRGLATAQAARRFQYEGEVLAGLRHPSIATIHATGLHEGAPWLAMELIEGARTLTESCEAEELGLARRLELFAEACDAVHFGHLKGVIHRDLKAENLLVDRDGRVRVIDFGVARAVDWDVDGSTLLTMEGAVVGTLATMSPEQVSGAREDLDLRTDVYSLGAVLYQLVTGVLPHDVARLPLPEAARVIREEQPVHPSALRPELAGDLETIVLSALEKDVSRRYQSAAALADDVRRFLEDEPIHARPASMAYQLRLFARRNRVLVGAALAITAVSLVAAGVSLRYAWAEERAARDADRRAELVRSVGRDLLYEVLASLEDVPGASRARAEVAETALRYLGALAAEVEDDPAFGAALLPDLLEGYLRLGEFQGDPNLSGLGETGLAITSYERARELGAELANLGPELEGAAAWREATLGATLQLGRLYQRVGRTAEGEALLREAQAEAVELELPARQADALISLGDEARSAGEHTTAHERFDEAHRLYRETGYAAEAAMALGRLGELAIDRQDFDEAVRYEEQRQLAIEALLVSTPGDTGLRTDLVDTLADQARIEERRGDATRSRALAGEAIPIAEALARADPTNAAARTRLAWLLDVRGAAERALGEDEAAVVSFDGAAQLYEQNLLVDPGDVEARVRAAELRTKANGTRMRLGRAAEAVDALAAAVDTLEEIVEGDPAAEDHESVLCFVLDVYGQALVVLGELEQAEPVLERFLEVAESVAERSPEDAFSQRQLLLVHDRMGVLHERLGEVESRGALERAESYYRAAESYGACLETFDILRERGFLNPGDDAAAPHVRSAIDGCLQAAATLEAAAAAVVEGAD